MKKESEFDLYHVDCGNLQISRVNIIGTVVNKFIADDRRYGFITIDDGSACIRAKTFAADNNLISNVQKGSLVMEDKDNKQEFFIPFHRLSEVTYKGKTYWRL